MTIYTPPEVARRWHCKPDTVRALLTSGKLRGFKVGRSHWRISEAAVLAYERGEAPAVETPRRRRRQQPRSIPSGPF